MEKESLDALLERLAAERSEEAVDALSEASKALVDLEREVCLEAEEFVRRAMVGAVGIESDSTADLKGALRRFMDAVQSVNALLEGSDDEGCESVPPESESVPPEVEARARAAMEAAAATVAEAGAEEQFRLLLRLRVSAAEIRMMINEVPRSSELSRDLVECIASISRAKNDAGIQEFIKGLGRSQHGNWPVILERMKRELQRFDADAARGLPNGKPARQRAEEREPAPAPSWQWPPLPNLRKRMESAPVFVVGGDERAMKSQIVKTRFGLDIEWIPIPKKGARACESAVSRIRSGRPAGVMILDGIISHSFWDTVRAACDAVGSPYSAAGTGGIGDLGAALDSLEAKISDRLLRAEPGFT